jgi:hypothetical protein
MTTTGTITIAAAGIQNESMNESMTGITDTAKAMTADLRKRLEENGELLCGLDHGIGHFMLVEVDSKAQAAVPPMPKSLQTSTAASDRKTAPQPSSRQAA